MASAFEISNVFTSAGKKRSRTPSTMNTASEQPDKLPAGGKKEKGISLFRALRLRSRQANEQKQEDFPVEWISMPSTENSNSLASPYQKLIKTLESRGYIGLERNLNETDYIHADEEADKQNSPAQQQALRDAIAANDHEKLTQLLNKCNVELPWSQDFTHEESTWSTQLWDDSSMLHTLCRKGQSQCLEAFLNKLSSPEEAQRMIRVYEGYGQTALHAICQDQAKKTSKPNFDVVALLLKFDPHMLFITDDRGCTPLYYIRETHEAAWNAFLQEYVDTHFPIKSEH